MTAGIDHIGIGVGALIFDSQGQVFLSKRGPQARNEVGCWEFPGGGVQFNETMEQALRREIEEEYGITINVIEQLAAFDHLLPDEAQHWVSVIYLAHHSGGSATILEPEKCSGIGWYSLTALPAPVTSVTQAGALAYLTKFGAEGPRWHAAPKIEKTDELP